MKMNQFVLRQATMLGEIEIERRLHTAPHVEDGEEEPVEA
jgi:hypothetical protein